MSQHCQPAPPGQHPRTGRRQHPRTGRRGVRRGSGSLWLYHGPALPPSSECSLPEDAGLPRIWFSPAPNSPESSKLGNNVLFLGPLLPGGLYLPSPSKKGGSPGGWRVALLATSAGFNHPASLGLVGCGQGWRGVLRPRGGSSHCIPLIMLLPAHHTPNPCWPPAHLAHPALPTRLSAVGEKARSCRADVPGLDTTPQDSR